MGEMFEKARKQTLQHYRAILQNIHEKPSIIAQTYNAPAEARNVVKADVRRKAVARVVAIGTKEKPEPWNHEMATSTVETARTSSTMRLWMSLECRRVRIWLCSITGASVG